jgi:hypothetical protein
MPARIRTNPDETLVELETPEGDILGPLEIYDEDGEGEPIFIVDEENPNAPAYVAIVAEYDGLLVKQVYQLVPVVTEVELNAELEDPDDDDEDDDEDVPLIGDGA